MVPLPAAGFTTIATTSSPLIGNAFVLTAKTSLKENVAAGRTATCRIVFPSGSGAVEVDRSTTVFTGTDNGVVVQNVTHGVFSGTVGGGGAELQCAGDPLGADGDVSALQSKITAIAVGASH